MPRGARSCVGCRKGQFAAAPGSNRCTACEWGRYAETSGTSQCTACPTTSPASLLQRAFGERYDDSVDAKPHDTGTGGSVHCSGAIGAAQRPGLVIFNSVGV